MSNNTVRQTLIGKSFSFLIVVLIGTSVTLSMLSLHAIESAYASENSLSSTALTAQATSTALTSAKKVFGVADGNVIEATSVDAITSGLSTAKSKAGANMQYIVHVASGTFNLTKRLSVPSNVILVSESGVKYIWSGSSNDHMINVAGVVYGGSFSGGASASSSTITSVLRFAYSGTFSGNNGIIQEATVINSGKNGICVREPNCKNAQIIGCTIKNNNENGITVEKDAQCALISNTISSGNGRKDAKFGYQGSGVNISHSNVGNITKCTLSSNKDKGISTNSDTLKGATQPGCSIGAVTGCTIKDNKVNGVYLKPKCYIDNFTGNTVSGNGDGLVCAGKTEAGTTGSSYAKNVKNNTFSANQRGQVVAQDKGAVIYLGSKNKITKGSNSGILASKHLMTTAGIVRITGNGNIISGNKMAGISVQAGGQLIVSGKSNQIKNNKAQGIYCKAGKVTISSANNQISSNGKTGISAYSKSTVSISGKGLTLKSNKGAGVYVIENSTLNLKGRSCTIQGNTDMGVMAKKSTVKITGASINITSNKTAGAGIYDSAKLTITGKGSKIQKNGTFGIYAKNKASATVKNTSITGNKKGASYVTGKAKVTIK